MTPNGLLRSVQIVIEEPITQQIEIGSIGNLHPLSEIRRGN